jgi:hypothetical protein
MRALLIPADAALAIREVQIAADEGGATLDALQAAATPSHCQPTSSCRSPSLSSWASPARSTAGMRFDHLRLASPRGRRGQAHADAGRADDGCTS